MREYTEEEKRELQEKDDLKAAKAGAKAMAKVLIGEIIDQHDTFADEYGPGEYYTWARACGVYARLQDLGRCWLGDVRPEFEECTPDGWDSHMDGKYVGQDRQELYKAMETIAERLYEKAIMDRMRSEC